MRLKHLIKENQLECQVKSTTMWRLRQVALKSIYLANLEFFGCSGRVKIFTGNVD